jgi:fructokinase
MRISEQRATVVSIGESLWDRKDGLKMPGGAPANLCHRLGQLGIPTQIATRLGNDPLGNELLQHLTSKNFDLSLIQRDSIHPTGTVDIIQAANGDASYTINRPAAYDYLEATDELLAAARAARAICFGTLAQRNKVSGKTIHAVLDAAHSAVIFLDINLRKDCFSQEAVVSSVQRAEILKLNNDEVPHLCTLLGLSAHTPADLARQVLKTTGVKVVLITLDADGVYAMDRAGTEARVPGVPVTVVDIIGSGDSFSAGFLSKYLQGSPV